ncbi:hypothetical protein [Glycomyces buryatensis]|uniref:DUF3558 domain-containing protein n=1 Tax=Glycomyces buryatensis TaxID=2570927 RepID=A0A4S8QC41_9ACTN|nr:hypothetical protein [Glycomyces buryatensis]THV40512.1 hypothetical protein FAB82_14665 [Glycomyces buryatensis]
MKRALAKTFAASAAAALLLSGCSLLEGDDDTEDGAIDDPIYNEIATWDACEVLDYLKPIEEKMGIVGWGSSSSEGGEPGNSELGNTWDPGAIGCNDLIYLGNLEGMGMSGEIKVKIVPTPNMDDSDMIYEDRVSVAEAKAAENENANTEEFTGSWDRGAVVSWTGSSEQPHVWVVAQSGQWVFHIDLYYSSDFGVRNNGDPALLFTEDELNQWFVDTYLPEVNQTVNDRLAELL